MKLFGTTTSPFVRRVRVVAAELGIPVERIDTATDGGMAELRSVSPIRKVPVAELDGQIVFDSREIIARLFASHGRGPFAAATLEEANLVNAIDGALDSVIQLFYLRRDGVAIDGTPYATRQLERTDAIFAWLGSRVSRDRLGLAELSIICALDWMDFRKTYPTERAGAADIRAAFADRASIRDTKPHA